MKSEKGKIILLKREKKKTSCFPLVLTDASARTYGRVVLKKRKTNGPAIISCAVNSFPKKFFINSNSIIPRMLAGFLALLLSVNPVVIVYAMESEVETVTAITTAPEEEAAEDLFEETSDEDKNGGIETQPEVFSTNDADLLAAVVEEQEDGTSDTEVTKSAPEIILDDEETSSAGDEEDTDTDGEEDPQTGEGSLEETEEGSDGTDEESAVDDTETENEDEAEGGEEDLNDEEDGVIEDLPDTEEDDDAVDNNTASTTDDVGDETNDDGETSTQANEPEEIEDEPAEEDQEMEEGDDTPLPGGEGDGTDYSEEDETEDESFDESSSGEEENETEDAGDGAVADDQKISEELPGKTIDEALVRAEIEKAVETRVKKEYEEKIKNFLEEQQKKTPEEIQNFQSTHSFNDAECEVLSDNEIYCRRDSALTKGDDIAEVFTGVFTQEGGGDSEIVFQYGGQTRQITDNDHSDINPVYDEKSDRIVWQTLINGRWQIMTHDLAKGVTEQISGGGFNNINPHIFGDTIVWQGWAGSNWDIFYAQYITLEDQTSSWSVVRVTDNTWPDVGPRVVGDVVLWEAFMADSWQVFNYEIKTGALIQVSQGKGDNRNPRLVVLWDSEEEGTAQTIQYDISTGERFVLNTTRDKKEDFPQEIPTTPLSPNQAILPVAETSSRGNAGSGRDNDNGE